MANATNTSLTAADLLRLAQSATNSAVTANAGTRGAVLMNQSATSAASQSSDPVTQALKEALGQGLQMAITRLGAEGGFLTNAQVKIPMPDKLQQVERTLRALQQDALADQFIASMNHAAEQAVPAAASVFSGALKQMTISDAKMIVTGGTNDAATQFFRRTTEPQLRDKFTPIVKDATAQAGVTAAYKKLTDRAQGLSPFLNLQSLDVDSYVTTKAMDGLFKMVAEEEKRIRENPAARTTDLLKSVFGLIKKPVQGN